MSETIIAIIIISLLLMIVAAVVIYRLYWQTFLRIRKERSLYDALDVLLFAAVDWITINQYGYSVKRYLEAKGYHTVAIYGMGRLGERLYDELKDSKINVCYAIDRDYNSIYTSIPVYPLNKNLTKVDVVIVTTIAYFEEIKKELSNYGMKAISLKSILSDVLVKGN